MRVARPVSGGELVDALGSSDRSFFSEPTFVVTIDDGYLNVFEIARPMFESLGIHPVVFIPVDWIGFDGSDDRLAELYLDPTHHLIPDDRGHPRPMMSAPQLRMLVEQGWEIGSHSSSHIDLTSPEADLESEIVGSRERLGAILDTDIRMFSFPHGQRQHVSRAVLDKVRAAGYEACFTCSGGRIVHETDPYFINRDVVDDWWSGGMTSGMYRGVLDRWRHYETPEG